MGKCIEGDSNNGTFTLTIKATQTKLHSIPYTLISSLFKLYINLGMGWAWAYTFPSGPGLGQLLMAWFKPGSGLCIQFRSPPHPGPWTPLAWVIKQKAQARAGPGICLSMSTLLWSAMLSKHGMRWFFPSKLLISSKKSSNLERDYSPITKCAHANLSRTWPAFDLHKPTPVCTGQSRVRKTC